MPTIKNLKEKPPIMGGFCVGSKEKDRRFDRRNPSRDYRPGFQYMRTPDTDEWNAARKNQEEILKTINKMEKNVIYLLELIRLLKFFLQGGGHVSSHIIKDISEGMNNE